MRKRIAFFLALLFITAGAKAEGVIVSVKNDVNTVPGYKGSFDVVLKDAGGKQFGALEMKITLPDKLTYDSFKAGDLMSSHTPSVTDNSNVLTITAYASPSEDFTAETGTLITIYYNVAADATEGSTQRLQFKEVTLTTKEEQQTLVDDFTYDLTVGKTVTLSETSATAPGAIDGVNVNVKRTLKKDVWNSIVLPFALTASQMAEAFGSDAEVADFTGYSKVEENEAVTSIKVNFATVTAMDANHPYIVKVTEDKTEFAVTGVNIAPVAKPIVEKGVGSKKKNFVGTYVPISIPGEGLFLSSNQFMYSKGTSTLKGYRAYFQFFDVLIDYYGGASSRITMDVNSGGTTSIKALKSQETDKDYYDMQGRRIVNPAKGLYIQNGKKVIIK